MNTTCFFRPTVIALIAGLCAYAGSPDENFQYSAFGTTGFGLAAGYAMNWTTTGNDLKHASEQVVRDKLQELKSDRKINGIMLSALYDLPFHRSRLRLHVGLDYLLPSNYSYNINDSTFEVNNSYIQPFAALALSTKRSGSPQFYANAGPQFTIKKGDGDGISRYSDTYFGIQSGAGMVVPVGRLKVVRTTCLFIQFKYSVVFENDAVKQAVLSGGVFI